MLCKFSQLGYPAHIVNAWMGHTEAVAMAHYRQTGKAADKFYDQAAGAGALPGKEAIGEHAGMGCFGVETKKTGITASPCISIPCNSVHNPLHDKNLGQVAAQGLKPRTRGL